MNRVTISIIALALAGQLAGCTNSSAAGNGPAGKAVSISADETEPGNVIHLTRAEFLSKVSNYEKNSEKWVYEGDKPCIVDFYADWCQPCKIAGPILEELAGEYKGKIYVYKVNTDEERELAAAFGIRSIPTFLLCPVEGQPQVFTGIGQSKEATKDLFTKAIDEVLLKTKN